MQQVQSQGNDLVSNPAFQLAYAMVRMRNGDMRTSELDLAVALEMDRIQGLARDTSLTSRLADAVHIRATVTGIVFEQSSQRYRLSFLPARSTDGRVEEIRSDRVDRSAAVTGMFSGLRPGDEVLIYKTNEVSERSQAAGVSSGYRVCPYLRVLRHAGATA